MKRFYLVMVLVLSFSASAFSQVLFDVRVDPVDLPTTVQVPASPLRIQPLFIGGTDEVVSNAYSGSIETTVAKEWHDFIGFTPVAPSDNETDPNVLGWISVNHERILMDDVIGDGGGMTAFKIAEEPGTGNIIVVEQTLNDGRTGKFFNVDFINTVGETGMNCGGIISVVDGRIWTAEEWFRGI